MQKILYLTENFDGQAQSGGKIKTLETITALSPHFSLRILSLNSLPLKRVSQRNNFSHQALWDERIEIPIKKRLGELFFEYLRGNPYYFFQYRNEAFQKLVTTAIAEFQPDIIHVDHLTMAQYLPSGKKQHWVYEEHNVEHRLRLQMARHSKKLGFHWLIWLAEGILLFFKEKKLLPKFDQVWAISNRDARLLQHFLPVKKISVQPFFFPIVTQKKLARSTTPRPTLLFVGDLEWLPNRDALSWFIQKILPKILKKLSTAELLVAGNADAAFIQKYQRPGVTFLGPQPSLDSLWSRATLSLVPFRMAEGVRMKILTALSHGVPIVATSAGIRGTHLRAEIEVLIAENPREFVQQIIQLVRSPVRTRILSKRGFKYLKKYHSIVERKKFAEQYLATIKLLEK